MRCRTCDYPLWNLSTRQCPECGAGFSPRDFEFVPSSVRFFCPHCRQDYYGTDARGHLEPDDFDCVSCGRRVSIDAMLLLPAEGFTEERTRPGFNPWLLRRRLGWWKGWFGTAWGSLVAPGRLMRGTDVSSSLTHAWWFLIVTLGLSFAVSFAPAMCLSVVMARMIPIPPGGGPTPGVMAMMMAGGTVFGFVAGLLVFIAYAPVWGLTVHALLRLGGPVGPLRRTMQAICYSSGTFVTSVIPCISNFAMLWWIVSAVLMVRQGHRVGGARAAFAVVTFPLCLLGLLVIGYALLLGFGLSMARAAPAPMRPQEAQRVLTAVLDHAAADRGRGPAHATVLLADGALKEWAFVSAGTLTDMSDVAVGDQNLLDLGMMEPGEKRLASQAAAQRLPPGAVAHRVGDFVFTYHGIDLRSADPGLWVLVMSPDPAVNGFTVPRSFVVGRADGTVVTVPAAQMAAQLDAQNQLRAAAGLPPLPHPSAIR